jgi:uncharacterized protein YbcI
MESAVCKGMSRFELEYMDRGPKDIHTHVFCGLLVLGLQAF